MSVIISVGTYDLVHVNGLAGRFRLRWRRLSLLCLLGSVFCFLMLPAQVSDSLYSGLLIMIIFIALVGLFVALVRVIILLIVDQSVLLQPVTLALGLGRCLSCCLRDGRDCVRSSCFRRAILFVLRVLFVQLIE